MAEERRKRRSREEVAAAREQYLKEREARQQARAERQAQREKLIAERQARKEQRERFKAMSEAERAQIRYEKGLEKVRKLRKEGKVHPIQQIAPYGEQLELGKWYTIRFAGGLIYGEYVEEKAAGMDTESGEYRRYGLHLFRSKKVNKYNTSGFWIYPATLENVLCEGVLTAEKCGGLLDPRFNGISYY